MDGGYPAPHKLKAITPRGGEPLRAAYYFFAAQKVCEAAQIECLHPDTIEPEQRGRMVMRYGMALDRLETLPGVGAFLPTRKPASMEEVAELAEQVLDRLLRAPSAPPVVVQPPAPVAPAPAPTLVGVIPEQEDPKTGKRSEGLEGASLRKSVPYSVAEKLQAAQSKLELGEAQATSYTGGVATGIMHLPETLRPDLQKALMSKARVHGPGMLLSQLWLPPTVHSWKQKIEYLVCLLYTSPSPRDRTRSRMPSSA